MVHENIEYQDMFQTIITSQEGKQVNVSGEKEQAENKER